MENSRTVWDEDVNKFAKFYDNRLCIQTLSWNIPQIDRLNDSRVKAKNWLRSFNYEIRAKPKENVYVTKTVKAKRENDWDGYIEQEQKWPKNLETTINSEEDDWSSREQMK